MRRLFVMACFALCPVAAFAQQPSDLEALSSAEAEARAKEAALTAKRAEVTREIDKLKVQLRSETEQTRAFEREADRLNERLEELTARITTLQTELQSNRAQTQTLFASMQRLQLAPSVATFASPDDAVATAQASTMIGLLSDELRQRAARTLELTRELEASRTLSADRQAEISANSEELAKRRARTAALVAQKETLRASIQTDEQKARAEANRLASEAETLRELLESLSAAARDVTPRLKPGAKPGSGPVTLPPGTVRFAEAKGGLIRPVSGRMTRAYGGGERGQTYSAPTGGQVLAPYAGRVEFSGAFRNYGQVVILNMDDGYFLLLTGLQQTFVEPGETVTRGEPVGRMPDTGSRSPLYLELRRNGRTIDPSPWMS